MGIKMCDKADKPKKYSSAMDKPLGFEKHIFNRIWLGAAHLFGAQGFFWLIFGQVPRTIGIFCFCYSYLAGFGTTLGCHRFWAHKTFRAKIPLQILLAFMQTSAAQYPIFKWCRDHRLHHKFVETDADPHDARRGFWFSHIGWLFVKEHPAVKEKEATIDLSDLDNDPIVRFQTKYHWYLILVAFFSLPMWIQHLMWPELSLYQLFCLNYVWYLISLHGTWLVNSAAHMWGAKPYEKSYLASDNWVLSLLAVGEGWHNYHHTFPWDYKAAELGLYRYNWSTMAIDFFAWMGWAYDLKTVPERVVQDRVKRTGDGSHSYFSRLSHLVPENGTEDGTEEQGEEIGVSNLPPWGWGDKDIPEEHYQLTANPTRTPKDLCSPSLKCS